LLVVFLPKLISHTRNKASSSIFKPPLIHQFQRIWDTYGNLETVIGQDEGGVRAGELSGRHVDGWTGCLEESWGWERRREENANDRHPNRANAPCVGKSPRLGLGLIGLSPAPLLVTYTLNSKRS
jgi:hypothetical protein